MKRPQPAPSPVASVATRLVLLTAGRVAVRVRLYDTPSAERLWRALPLFSTAETWGDSIHAELPIESGRERNARINGRPGELYYWSEDDRILIVFGPTPISRRGEIRLPRPCNPLGVAVDDVTALKSVTPGEKLSIKPLAAEEPTAKRG